MNPAKCIVLTTHGTLGDLHPYLAIALELKARGHRPIIASSECHRHNAARLGLEFSPIRPDISFDNRQLHRRFTEPKRGLERVIREYIMPVLRQTYDDLLTVVQNERADLLISQILIFAAPLVAEKTGIRWISTELQPGAFLSAYDPPVLAPAPWLAKLRRFGPTFHVPLFQLAKLPGRPWSRPVRQLRSELHLPQGNDPLFAGRHSPRLVLALFSRLFGAPQPDWPPNTLVTGFPFFDESNSSIPRELASFLERGEPPVVFTLGSSAVWDAGKFYVESTEAVRKLKTRAVLLIGSDPINRISEPLPTTVLALHYAAYASIFPRASAIVHHGGIGTTGQALRAGKPMLVMPFGGDQFDNGARVEKLGVGRTIRRDRYSADPVAVQLQELLVDSQLQKRAADVAQYIRQEDGVRLACDAIQAQLASGA